MYWRTPKNVKYAAIPAPCLLYTSYSEIRSEGYKSLQENQRVTFEVGTGPKGPSAKNIKVAA